MTGRNVGLRWQRMQSKVDTVSVFHEGRVRGEEPTDRDCVPEREEGKSRNRKGIGCGLSRATQTGRISISES